VTPGGQTEGMLPFNIEGDINVPKSVGETQSMKREDRSCLGRMKENIYIVQSFAAAICFGVHNYLVAVGMHKWRNSVTILFPEFIPFIVIFIIYHMHRAKTVVKPATGGLWWTKGRSVFYHGDGTLKWATFFIVLTRAVAADLIPINISLTTYFCKDIGTSPAVI
jgi:hypothetical protein